MLNAHWLHGEQRSQKVLVSDLEAADSPRLDGLDAHHLSLLSETAPDLPPIVVNKNNMRVIDGMHRLRVAMFRGEHQIDAVFFDGSEAEAFVLAVELNRAHGLPLSNKDRKAAATRILRSHPGWSDRRIAKVAGLAPSTVGIMRARSVEELGDLNTRIGRDGRARHRDIDARRELARNLMESNPEASLRQVAREAGISPATVHDVRRRLKNSDEQITFKRDSAQRSGEHADMNSKRVVSKEFVMSLKRDPSLRFNEAGRILLRFLDFCTLYEDLRKRIVESIPSHQLANVVLSARECSAMWQELARELERRVQDSPRAEDNWSA